ncbi:uncharacterized protein LOC132192725 [Neocloeon triangulifer]|uniref:uncharacterized protein LOC132192725 n=1 Tax=Neocloeon triangulifer TaxID=2078957 RepID=UPI00286F452A|nr:uncharacterized protein LOC132192725 [Neocloeon triangulifer]
MARFVFLLVLLVAAALASESATKAQESEQLKIFNEMNQKLKQLTKLVHDQVEVANQRHNQTLESLAENHKHLEDIETTLRCVKARAGAGLTLLANGKSYSFQLASKNWSSANETCVKQGLQLATIRDEYDLMRVVRQGREVDRDINSWWVSAKNSANGDVKDFRWHDGTQLESNSTLWKKDDQANEDCVRIYYYLNPYNRNSFTNAQLYRHSCTESTYYVCELPSEC